MIRIYSVVLFLADLGSISTMCRLMVYNIVSVIT